MKEEEVETQGTVSTNEKEENKYNQRAGKHKKGYSYVYQTRDSICTSSNHTSLHSSTPQHVRVRVPRHTHHVSNSTAHTDFDTNTLSLHHLTILILRLRTLNPHLSKRRRVLPSRTRRLPRKARVRRGEPWGVGIGGVGCQGRVGGVRGR